MTFVCEGQNSEPNYFQALRRHLDWTLIDIVTVGGVGVPSTIYKRAVAERRKNNTGDSFTDRDKYWAIFDRDEHPCYYEAINSCRNNGIELGISNPCFELWLLLHIDNYDKPDDRHTIQRAFKNSQGQLNTKAKEFAYDDLVKNFEKAVDRAKKQYERRCKEKDKKLKPPYTTLFGLSSVRDIE